MRVSRFILAVTTAGLFTLLFFLPANGQAKTYTSSKGGYYIQYPDDWEQIDYRSVDFYLTNNNPDPALLDYEAVFAPKSDSPFYSIPYFLMTIDTVGELTGAKRDSAIATIVAGFSEKVDSTSGGDLVSRIRADLPIYDPQTGTLFVQTDMHEGRVTVKRNLLVVKFYSGGLANLFFYAPDSSWAAVLPTLVQIAQSFTPGRPAAGPKESVRVANLETHDSGSLNRNRNYGVFSGVFVVLLIVIIASRRRRKRQAESSRSV